MDSSKLKLILIVVLAMCFALYLGIAAATAQIEALAWVGGGLFLTICLLLGRHVWILIPATLGMGGNLNFIPGAPAPWQLMTAVTALFFLLRWLTRQQPFHFRWSGMDWAVLLVALTILQAFMRNPAGLSLLGGDVAGGKPYVIFAIAMIAFVLIGMADADLRSWRWAVFALIAFALADGIVSAISGLSPAFAELMIRYYSNVSYEAATTIGYSGNISDTRVFQFAQLGSTLGLIACTFWRPVAALDLRKPWRAIIALAAVVFTVLGGFRSNAARLFVNFTAGSLLRRKPLDVFVIGFFGFLVLIFLLAAVPSSSLPYSIRRILSAVPGANVGSDVAQDTESSNEFRFEMWKLALSSDRYISNKWLGDGFQISASELAAREAARLKDYRMSGNMTTMETSFVMGSYHGFHVETIRFTGAVGLIVATAALIVFAVFANRCIRHYRGHPWWGYVLFICMPYLIYPWWYWLVFGSYRSEFPSVIALAGMIKLLETIRVTEQQAVNEMAVPAKKTGLAPLQSPTRA